MPDPHREACRRQHRIIGNYLAIQAWLRKLDCIVIDRGDLEKFLGLERFKSTRVGWLEEDLKAWFPYQVAYYRTGSPSTIASLYLSRVQIEMHLPDGSMTTDQRISRMSNGSPKTERFSKNDYGSEVPAEQDIVGYLVSLAAGLRTPKPYKKRAKKWL